MSHNELWLHWPQIALKLGAASLLGGGSYLLCRLISEKVRPIVTIFGSMALLVAFATMIIGCFAGWLMALVLSGPLLIPGGLGSWFHLLSIRGTKREKLYDYEASAWLLFAATGLSFAFGAYFLSLFYSLMGSTEQTLWLICLITSPSLTPLFICGRRNMKPRLGYDTPFEERSDMKSQPMK